MKIIESSAESSISYGALIEKIEILRSTLRWASKLDRPQIQKLLTQCNSLRDVVMKLSHKERFVKASSKTGSRRKQTATQRRKALLDRSFVFEGVFGESPQLLDSLEIAEKAAPTDLPVLIDGESGTGKELMAKVIHANGSRSDMPYISVNCGAIPENLLESELFGHKRGAFTGASSDRSGKFEAADKGTIFLDEIGDLPLPGQVKLLRVLQSSEIQRVGSDHVIEVDTRVVAATNKNLLEMCKQGTFREDLYYRLSVIDVTLPPLRERKDEIPLLIEYFSDEAAEKLNRSPIKLSRRLRTFLLDYDYPGNIRELRNTIYRLTCLAGNTADHEHLPETLRSGLSASKDEDNTPVTELSLSDLKKNASDQAEKQFLVRGLQHTAGKVSELARHIDMNRSHLQTLLKKHGIQSKDYRIRS
ncbi:MAG: sigma 54-interacting transcriptional regulator [Pseudomonadota bacterium]